MNPISAVACALALAITTLGQSASAQAQQVTVAGNRIDPLLVSPRVGDLYAVELSFFARDSVYNVGSGSWWWWNEDAGAYGLLKVVEVRADRVIAVPEESAWEHPRDAINDLKGNLAGIRFDGRERITLRRADFGYFIDEEKILDVRRP